MGVLGMFFVSCCFVSCGWGVVSKSCGIMDLFFLFLGEWVSDCECERERERLWRWEVCLWFGNMGMG